MCIASPKLLKTNKHTLSTHSRPAGSESPGLEARSGCFEKTLLHYSDPWHPELEPLF